jgi:hypothetical protein
MGFALQHQAQADKLEQRRVDGQLSTAEYQSYLDRVHQRNNSRAAAVLSGLGGGLLMLTATILFVNENTRPQARAVARRWTPSVGPGQAGVVLRF